MCRKCNAISLSSNCFLSQAQQRDRYGCHHNVLEDSKTVGEYLLQKNPYLVLKSVVQCFSIYVQYKDVQKQLTVHSRFTVGALKEQINSVFLGAVLSWLPLVVLSGNLYMSMQCVFQFNLDGGWPNTGILRYTTRWCGPHQKQGRRFEGKSTFSLGLWPS